MEQPPQHPLESQLQAWAETRRLQCGAPFELHPADRHQLQQEVQRTCQNPTPINTRPAWRLLLPRLALITALTSAFMFALTRWIPHNTPATELAQNSPPTKTIPNLPPLEKAQELPAMGAAALNSEPPAPNTLDVTPISAPREKSPPQARPSATLPPTLDQPVGGTTIPQLVSRQVQKSTAPSDARAADRMESFASSAILPVDAPAEQPKAPTQPLPPPDWTASFRRQQPVARRNLNAPSYPILQSFQVEQRGDSLQMIDADGSVYRGETTAEAPTASPENNPLTQNYRFTVSGTHQSSRRTVQFEGLIENTIPPQIQGRASLDQRDRIVIRAASVPQR